MLDVWGSLEIEPLDDMLAATKPFLLHEAAPSVVSPMLVQFAVEEELKLPWTISSTLGLAAHGPVVSTFGPQKDVEPSIVGTKMDGHSEAM
jgi:hypothetical protein